MAHRTTHRRTIAPPPDPTTAKPKLRSSIPHFQPKIMSTSAIFEPSTKPISDPVKSRNPTKSSTNKDKHKKEQEHDRQALFKQLDFKKLSVSLVSTGGDRRRSSAAAPAVQIDLEEVFANNRAKVVAVDMLPFMQIHAIDCARKTCDSLEKFTSKTLALTLKKEFDNVYGPAWHCIVGKSFGSFVTHSVGGFLYFSMDQKLYVLLFKTSVQKAGGGGGGGG